MRRKKCRAAACPRKINDDQLFCRIHLQQLTPSDLSPIADNREPPNNATPELRQSIVRGTRRAVAKLAKKEGRASALSQAQRAVAVDAGQGGSGNAGSGGIVESETRADAGRETERYDLR